MSLPAQQYVLDGPTTVNLGETHSYTIRHVNGSIPQNMNTEMDYWYGDAVINGFTGSYEHVSASSVQIQFTAPGTVNIFVAIDAGLLVADATITVNGAYPNVPNKPTFNNDVCNPILTRSGTPQNGDIWYWQGKDANGTSTTKGSGTTYIPNEGSGTYYIRAMAATGLWSNESASVEISIISKTLWYTDVDNDGLGDPNSTPISSCTKPSGRVSNNFDLCPTVSGSPLNNGCSGSGDTGATDKNYVHTITPLVAVDNISEITDEDDKIETVTYFDGLGRTIQNVAIRAGGQKQDIKSPMVYDDFGREAITYLPHATVTSSVSSYTSNSSLIADLNSYYYTKHPSQLNSSDINAFAEKRFDNSPLSRTLESSGPGKDWAINPNSDNDHTTKYGYGTNITDNIYKIDYPGAGQPLSIAQYYTRGELTKSTVKNANWIPADGPINTKDVYTDKGGKKIAEFSYINESSSLKTLKTYYVYDTSGNLVYVLTPKLFAIINGTSISVAQLNGLAFQYKYDIYNRQIEQKVPSKDWEYMVYDKLDRPILTQDNNLREDGKWLFTKYDAFGRTIYTGLFTSSASRAGLQTAVDNYISSNTTNLSNIENRTTGVSNIGGVNINYSNNAYPNTNLEVLTVSYYDSYSFTDADKPATPATVLGQTVTTRTNGLLTAAWTKTLNASTWAKSYTYYDEKARVINVFEKNHLGGHTQNKSHLDFRGKVTASLTEHKRTSSATALLIKDYFTYDHAERPISHTQTIGGDNSITLDNIVLDDESPASEGVTAHTASGGITLLPGFTASPGFHAKIEEMSTRELIALNTYDELGQLTQKKIGGETAPVIANSTGLQTVDYKYDIRGALKGVNDVDTMGNDLFAYEVNYESGEGANYGNRAQYNGNISQILWKSAYNNTKKTYYYDYDDLNRFVKGSYGEGSSLTSSWQKYEAVVNGYDENGNITGLTRRGGSSGNTIDNLNYYYDTANNNHNQLLRITDASGSSGFNNGSSGSSNDYEYDDNGNLIKDLNKGISLIEYNHLDLVTKVTFSGGKYLQFLYDAVGAKLQMQYVDGPNTTTTDYIGGFQYVDSNLKFFPTPEGYFEVTNSSPPSGELEGDHVYTFRDHLGNNRLAFRDNNGSNQIISSTDYYPMGLTHYGEYVSNSDYNYKHQGKEQLLANNYNMYDFGSRMYDAAVGRWFNTDPRNQFDSPYLAMGNNPVMIVDPDGEFAWFVPIIAGAIIGGASTAIQNPRADFGDILGGALMGAANGAITAGIGSIGAPTLVSAGLHGVVQGGQSVANGSNFFTGFATGAGSSLFGSATSRLSASTQIAAGGLSGGLISEFAGGSFIEGAASGLIVSGLNHALHKVAYNLKKNSYINDILEKAGIDNPRKLKFVFKTKKYATELKKFIAKVPELEYFLKEYSQNPKLNPLPNTSNVEDYGVYDSQTHEITLFKETFKSYFKLTSILFHEGFHAFQNRSGILAYLKQNYGENAGGNAGYVTAIMEYQAYGLQIALGDEDSSYWFKVFGEVIQIYSERYGK
ncbi:hypothetical protein MHTCC0001_08850 [Flavobacteriaceae bacterium MHTCC 0001]